MNYKIKRTIALLCVFCLLFTTMFQIIPTEVNAVEGNTHSGTWAMVVDLTGTDWKATTADITVTADTAYVVKFYIKGTGTIGCAVKNGNWSGDALAFEQFTDVSEWTEKTITFNSATNTQVHLQLVDTSGSGTMYIDDLHVGTGLEGAPNLIYNGDFEAGNSGWAYEPGVKISITQPDLQVSDANINPTNAEFDKVVAKQQDILVTMDLNTKSLTAIKNGVLNLEPETDYTSNGSTITIKAEYLATLSLGTATLTFDFDSGVDAELIINVIDSSLDNGLNTHSGDWALISKVSSSQSYNGVFQYSKTITKNTDYVFSAWIKGTGSIGLGAYTGADWSGPEFGHPYTASNIWTKVTLNFNSGSQTVAHLKISDITGTVYIDDIFFGVSAGSNLVDNAGFESGNSGWSIPNALTDVFSIMMPNIVSADITPKVADFYLNEEYQRNLSVSITPNGRTLVNINNGTDTLEKDYDYVIDTDTNIVIISKEYLSTLSIGNKVLTFDFDEGVDPTLSVSINEIAPPPASTDINTHSGSWALRGIYKGTALYDGTYQTISGVQKNTDYVAKAWVKGVGQARFRVLTANWGSEVAGTNMTANENEWTEVVIGPFNTGDNSSFVIQFQNPSNAKGLYYIDDIFLGEADGVNIVRNPYFEEGKTGWNEIKPFYIVRPAIDPLPAAPPKIIYKGSWKTYEAEKAVLSTGTIDQGNEYASAGNLVANISVEDRNVVFNSVKAGNTVSIRYSALANGTISLYVNGEKRENILIESTGTLGENASDFKETSIKTEIQEGAIVKVQYDVGDTAINLDLLRTYYGYEAEDAVLSGTAIEYVDSYASGGKAVQNLSNIGDSVTFENVTGGDELSIGYSTLSRGTVSLYVNNQPKQSINIDSTGLLNGDRAYYEQSIYTDIPGGATVTIKYENGNTPINLDYIKLVKKPILSSEYKDIPDEPMIIGSYQGISVSNYEDFQEWLERDDVAIYSTTGLNSWSDYDSSISWITRDIWSGLPDLSKNQVLWNVPVMPTPQEDGRVDSNLSDAARGAYIQHYLNQAKVISEFCADYDVIYIRPAWEFNGNWFPWTSTAFEGENQDKKRQDFIGAWREYVDAFRSVSPKFRFEWNFNIGQEGNPAELCYPGDDYVDLIGIDVYDENVWAKIDDPAKRFQYILTRQYGLIWHRDFAKEHNKRITFSEWGIGYNGSGDNFYLMEALYNWFIANNVVSQLYWDSNDDYTGKVSENDEDNNGIIEGDELSQIPLAAAKYKELFGSYTGEPILTNTPGNVIMAQTSPVGVKERDATLTLNVAPTVIKGIAVDPDGNDYITDIKVKISNSEGKYLDVAQNKYVNDVVYNVANYNSESTYWSLDISGVNLAAGTYTIRAYANDGGENIPAMGSFNTPAGSLPETGDVDQPSNPGTPMDSTNTETSSTDPKPVLAQDGSVTLEVKPKLDNKTQTAFYDVGKDLLDNMIKMNTEDLVDKKTILFDIQKVEGAKTYLLELPTSEIIAKKSDLKVKIHTELGNVTVPSNMFETETISKSSKMGISIGIADTSKMDKKVVEAIGDRPVIELKAIVDGKAVSWNNPDAPVTVTIDYKPTVEELKDTEHIVVWYIDSKGQATVVPNGRYNPTTGKISYVTTHFSTYAITSIYKTFSDANKKPWAKNTIEVVASKGILEGVTANEFSPEKKITRAEFIVGLVKILGLSTKVASNFDDIEATDINYNLIGIAKKLGITSGTGNNEFNPNSEISRQDMMVLTVKALQIAGKINMSETDSVLDKFSDKSKISGYAKSSIATLVKEGIISGAGKTMNPLSKLTKAEAAATFYKVLMR